MKKLLCLLILFSQISFAQLIPEYQTKVSDLVSFNATATSTLALAINVRRKFLFIQNIGSDDIYVKFSTVQTGNEGIKLIPNAIFMPLVAPQNSVYIKAGTSTSIATIYSGI